MAHTARWLAGILLLAPAGTALAQLSVQVFPDNGTHPDPKIRLANATGNTVQFTVTNNGTLSSPSLVPGSATSLSPPAL